jgi:membrane protease YdiL (CAAX protease family)
MTAGFWRNPYNNDLRKTPLMETTAPTTSRISTIFQEKGLPLYFGGAFLISWIFWFIEPLLRTSDPVAAGIFIQFGAYGPILAAMLVAAVGSPQRTPAPLARRLLAGGMALAVAVYANWSLYGYIQANGSGALDWVLVGLVTLLPGWIFFNTYASLSGVRTLLNPLTRWRTNPFWFAVALLLMLSLSVLGVLLVSLLSGQPLFSWTEAFLASESMRNLALTLAATALYGGPLGEEAGWRGFALPRLQKRFDPLLASVWLGLAWGLWHLPLHVTGYYNQAFGDPISGLLMRTFTTLPLTLIFTWLYNRTRGNLLVMVCLHTAVNVTSSLIAPGTGLYITTAVAVVLMVIFDRMYRKTGKELTA